MYIVSKSWLAHKDDRERPLSIFSLDVSQDGKRLATGGLDGKIRIWSVDSLLSQDDSNTGPRQLCAMSTHTGTVTCVRFSPNGKYLATGSDDRFLIIWTLDETGVRAKIFGNLEANIESWRSLRRLTGHDNDIQDIGWSYDSKTLISVGLDSTIIVWSGTTFEKLKTLSAHKSHVKGVTFDPANKYFATQSDDRTLKIWRLSDFHLEQTITLPFDHSPLTTYFRRPSWSPDGVHIAAANAMNGPVSSVCMIERGTWDTNISLIGHEGPVEVCAFNPKIFKRKDDTAMDKGQSNSDRSSSIMTVLACAGQDRKLSIWTTASPRPLLVVSEIATKGIGDISWMSNGQTLLFCSYDGSVKACVFEDGDLGTVLSDDDALKTLSKYGYGSQNSKPAETVEQLELESQTNKKDKVDDMDTSDIMNGISEKSKIMLASDDLQGVSKDVQSADKAVKTSAHIDENMDIEILLQNQKTTITKDGKKRVAPTLLQPSGDIRPSKSESARSLVPVNGSDRENFEKNAIDYGTPSHDLPPGGLKTLLIGNKRRAYTPEEAAEVSKKRSRYLSNSNPEFIRNVAVNPAIAISQIRLAVPSVRSVVEFSTANDFEGHDVTVEARNSSANAREPCRISMTSRGKTVWIDFLPRSVLLIGGTEHFWAAACEDGTVVVYSSAGRRLRAPITLEAVSSRMDCCGKFLMVITAVGLLHVWDIVELKAKHPPVSIAPVLDAAIIGLAEPRAAPAIKEASVTAKGKVFISLDDGESFIYDEQLLEWQKMSETLWALASQYWDSTGMRLPEPLMRGFTGKAERNTDAEIMKTGRGHFMQRIIKGALFKEGFENLEAVVSTSHLETRLAAAEVLQCEEEYKALLMLYCERLAQEGDKDKFDQVLSKLLGPLSSARESSKSSAFGADHQLLREILQKTSKWRQVQRVSIQYLDALNRLDKCSSL